jgi:hypothetical protein
VVLLALHSGLVVRKIPDALDQMISSMPSDLVAGVKNEELLRAAVTFGTYLGCCVYLLVLIGLTYAARRIEADLRVKPIGAGKKLRCGPLYVAGCLSLVSSAVLKVEKISIAQVLVMSGVSIGVFLLFNGNRYRGQEESKRLATFISLTAILCGLL